MSIWLVQALSLPTRKTSCSKTLNKENEDMDAVLYQKFNKLVRGMELSI